VQRNFFERYQIFFGLVFGSIIISASLVVATPTHTVEASSSPYTSLCVSGDKLYALRADGKVLRTVSSVGQDWLTETHLP
jgi:hypothetical protein